MIPRPATTSTSSRSSSVNRQSPSSRRPRRRDWNEEASMSCSRLARAAALPFVEESLEGGLRDRQRNPSRARLVQQRPQVLVEEVQRVARLVALPEASHPVPLREHPARAGTGRDDLEDALPL